MQHKTTTRAFLLVILFLSVSFVYVKASSARMPLRDQIPILIRPHSTNQPSGPRTPVANPFFAQFEDNYVLLGCTSPYGTVDVTLVSTAGDNYSTDFDTEDWTIVIPVRGNSGHYTLTLVTESGTIFVGEFDL